MDVLRQAWQGIRTRFGAMSVNQRLILGMVAAGVVISATVFGLWIGKEQNAVLFTDLAVEDAHRALEELEKRGIKATLAHNGTTILVPASLVHRLRLDLVATGVTGNSVVGYEIINNSSFGMTEQEFDVKRQQALEGELTRTITTLQGVDAARVHLALPKSSIFVSRATPPTASVVLRLKHQRAVSVDQVAGIQKLVAGSVEGLTVENVTVIDEHGRALTSTAETGSFSGSDRQLELKKEVEQYLTDKAQTLLTSILGPKKAHVRVDATLNFEQIESQRTTYDPQTVVRSEERNESTDPQSGAVTESSLTNYEVNQIVERVVAAAGGIKQLSVAVSVDGNYSVPADGEAPVYQPLPPQELDNLKRMMLTTLGLDLARGDQIEVVNLQFRQWEQDSAPTSMLPGGWLEFVLKNGGRLLLGLLLVVLVLMFRRNLAAALGEVANTAVAGRAAASGESGVAPGEEGERFDGMPVLTDQMAEDVRDYAAEHPERVAEVVQSWLHEPERSGR